MVEVIHYEWEGGSLRHPHSLVLYKYTFRDGSDQPDLAEIVARFDRECFHPDGTFAPAVVKQIQYLATQIKGLDDA